MALHAARGKLIGVIGDEDTCVGFLLGGVGELNKNRQPNFLVVDKNTEIQEIEDTLKSFIRREDISIILINQNVAEEVEIRYSRVSKEETRKDIYYLFPRSATFLTTTPLLSPLSWRSRARTAPTTPTRTPSLGIFSSQLHVYLFIVCPRLLLQCNSLS